MFSVALSVPEAYGHLSGIPLRPLLLASTLPCGVRTFLSPAPVRPLVRPLGRGSDHPACPRKLYDTQNGSFRLGGESIDISEDKIFIFI
jgi:hypothetical protein